MLGKHVGALELRKQGWSYPQIKRELQVSKSSLSLWLRDYPLTGEQLQKLSSENRDRRIERFRETFLHKRQDRLDRVYAQESLTLLPLSGKEFYLAGLMLYWGEGLKATTDTVAFSNTNPAMILFAIRWFVVSCGMSREKLRIRLHLYSDMDVELEQSYWSRMLTIPRSQFRKPYIKKSLRSSITEKGGFGHGTCDLIAHNTTLKERIMMGIKVVADIYPRDSVRI